MKLNKIAARTAAVVAAGAITLGAQVVGAGPAAAAWSPNTQAYCSGTTSCTISINYSSTTGRVEGQSIAGQVQMRANQQVSLRAYELLWDAAGNRTGVKAIGPAFTVTTDGSGRAGFSAPTQPLTAPSTGGTNKFVVQPSDFAAANWKSGHLLGNSAGNAPLFDLSSARGQVQRTDDYQRSSGKYYITQVKYAIPGHTYAAQLYVSGRWVDARESGVTNNGLTSTTGTAQVQWSKPSSVGTGVYNMRIINVTKNQVVLTSRFAVYYPGSGVWGDQDGDRRADILAVDAAGAMRTYVTRSGPSLSEGFTVGSGWGSMTWVSTLPDMDGNGYSEMLARRSDGTLWLYLGTDFGRFDSARKVGQGWTGLDQLTILPDINGDRAPEMLGRTTTGKLLRYKVTLSGAAYVNEVGSGWGSIIKVISLGDMTRDGVSDFVAIAANGNLYRYALNSSGRVTSTAHVGRYWQSMSQAFSPGDMDGDGVRDLVGRREDGTLFFYKNYANGSFGSARQIGTGWNGIRLFT